MRLGYLLEDHAQAGGFAAARAVASVIEESGHILPIRFYVDLGWRVVDRVNGPTGAPVWAALERSGYQIVVEVPRMLATARASRIG